MISFREFIAALDEPDASGRCRSPYPWQESLAVRLAAGEPLRAIVVPTGGGKTVTVEALLWALAMQAERQPGERTVGVRTVWAIDRRILVDEVHDRAARIAHRLSEAVDDESGALHDTARRLRSLAGDDAAPLVVTRWRGGIAPETRATHPFQPEIITSTVAQIGSRLLFRGYGVGERSLALEAGLAAVDTTICLDEAHLAEPFRQTVDAIRTIRSRETTALPGLRAITLTATPAADLADSDVHSIGEADRLALGARLTGEKLARLVEPESNGSADHTGALVDAVGTHIDDGARRIACVVNSVRTAIEVHDAVSRRWPDTARALLIGPQRPADRRALLAGHRGALFGRENAAIPFVCIATQTFEVGLDADVDALVTQSASAAALVQRLGRLNRAGLDRGRATIVRDTQSPLYAEDEPPAWAWLRSREASDGRIDVSVDTLMGDRARPEPVRAPTAPALTDDVIDMLVQTAPRPARMADPDVEVFLRGADEQPSADVGLCWRCDLRIDDCRPEGRSYRKALLRLVPPRPDEVVTLSLAKAHALLAVLRAPRVRAAGLERVALETLDVEGADAGPVSIDVVTAGRDDGNAPTRLVLMRGRDQLEVALGDERSDDDLRLRDIRPGDLLVLPTSAGGYAAGALAPASRVEVDDVAADLRDDDEDRSGEQAPLRLSTEALGRWGLADDQIKDIMRSARQASDQPSARALDGLSRLLGARGERLRACGDLDLRRITAETSGFLGDLDREEIDAGGGVVFEGETAAVTPAFVLLVRRTREEIRPRDETPPTLEAHATDVKRRADAFVDAAALPSDVSAAVVLAARAHDHGKADFRFQAFFRGGAPALLQPPIAKSVFGTADVQSARSARAAAGLPVGLRHEIASVAVLSDALASGQVSDQPDQLDAELALHLVGTHHGLGRPVPGVPQASGSGPREFAVRAAGISGSARGDADEGWCAGAWLRRFLTVINRYGPWGSAYLEALLMLADRSVSGEGR